MRAVMRHTHIYSLVLIVLGMFCLHIPVRAEGIFTLTSEFTYDHQVELKMVMEENSGISGFDIERCDVAGGAYTYLTTKTVWNYYFDDDDYWFYDWDDGNTETYIDDSVLAAYTTYYYRVTAFKYALDEYGDETEEKLVLSVQEIAVFYPGIGPTVTEGKRSGKNGSSLTWTSVAGAEGYLVYGMTDMDEKGNMLFYPDTDNESGFQLLAEKAGNMNTSANFKKLVNGVTYYYRIYAYSTVNGERKLSFSSDVSSVPMDYYAYASESYMDKVKRAFGSVKKQEKNFKTEQKARKQMKTISIKVWDFASGKKGKKVTRIKYLTVNKRLAPTIKQIFKEIYNSKEKQVIHDIGCYSYRTGEHMYGLAIDVNPNENYMIDGKKILSGKYWKPGKDPYSIPEDSDFVRIMNRYGFYRGEWGERRDYMHFSFFGG